MEVGLDTVAGVPFDAQTPCINSRESSGLNDTPVPKAKITINGKTYALGTSTPTGVHSYVQAYGAPASKPENSLVFAFSDSGPSPKTEALYSDISLNSLSQYVCRNWADAFSYTLQSTDQSTGNFDAIVPGNGSGSSNQYAFAYFNVKTVTVSGPGTAECFDVVSGAVRVAVGPSGKRIFAAFTPKGGLEAAEKACGVKFNWQQYIEVLPGASPFYPANTQLAPGNTPLKLGDGNTIRFKGIPDPKSPPYTAPPGFLDPEPDGYLIANVKTGLFVPNPSDAYPFYFDQQQLTERAFPEDEGLCFTDRPFDPFLPFDTSILFTTLLVEEKSPTKAGNIYYSWQWESNNTNDDVPTAGGETLLNLPQRKSKLGCPIIEN